MSLKKDLHPKNKHRNGYDFVELIRENRRLNAFLFENKFKIRSIDFSDPNGSNSARDMKKEVERLKKENVELVFIEGDFFGSPTDRFLKLFQL